MSSHSSPASVEIPHQMLRELPAMPAVATRIFRMVESPDTDAMDIARAISMDPLLTAKVLKMANSSYYAPTEPITNLPFAVTRMGLRALRNVVVVECLPLKGRGQHADPLMAGLWEHSTASAIGARLIGRRVPGCSADDAFVAGLLHDLGKSVLTTMRGKEYAAVVARVQAGGCDFASAERGAFGFDHAAIGAAVLHMWQLPEPFVQGVANHHDPASTPNPAMWSAAELASRASKALELGLEKRPDLDVADCLAGRTLGFGQPEAAALKADLAAAYKEEKSLFEI